MTKKQKQREESQWKHLRATLDNINRHSARSMDSEGKELVFEGDSRYETAPFQMMIIPHWNVYNVKIKR